MVRFDLKRLFRVPTPTERVAGLNLRPDLARAAVRMATDERSDDDVRQFGLCLLDSETVVCMVEGRCDRRLGLLALTTQRLIFRAHGSPAGQAQAHLLDTLSGVHSEVRSMTSGIVLHLTGSDSASSQMSVDKILGNQAEQFADAVRRQRSEPGALPVQDPVQELLELRARRAAGTISESDFRAAKIRLLDEL